MVSIVDPFFPRNKGGNYTLFLGLSVPGEVPRCSASVLVLLAGFLNFVRPKTYLALWFFKVICIFVPIFI